MTRLTTGSAPIDHDHLNLDPFFTSAYCSVVADHRPAGRLKKGDLENNC